MEPSGRQKRKSKLVTKNSNLGGNINANETEIGNTGMGMEIIPTKEAVESRILEDETIVNANNETKADKNPTEELNEQPDNEEDSEINQNYDENQEKYLFENDEILQTSDDHNSHEGDENKVDIIMENNSTNEKPDNTENHEITQVNDDENNDGGDENQFDIVVKNTTKKGDEKPDEKRDASPIGYSVTTYYGFFAIVSS